MMLLLFYDAAINCTSKKYQTNFINKVTISYAALAFITYNDEKIRVNFEIFFPLHHPNLCNLKYFRKSIFSPLSLSRSLSLSLSLSLLSSINSFSVIFTNLEIYVRFNNNSVSMQLVFNNSLESQRKTVTTTLCQNKNV